jgi:hypothetical protein
MRSIRSFAWLVPLALPLSSFGSIFQVVQLSEPAGFLSQTDAIHQGTNYPSVTPVLSSNGYAFGYWTIDGVRIAGPDGRSLTQVSSVIQAESTYKAFYFQESVDSDSDGIMDWFEYRKFGDLSRGPADDPDGDGFTNQREDQLGQDPLVKDLVHDGGLSSRTSTSFVYADTSMVKATIKSDPAGFVAESENFLALNSNVSTASLNGQTNGYHFAYWSVNGVRQAAPNGTAASQVDLNVSATSVIVAHYLPSNEDSDSDGVMDWFELHQFGSLTLGPNDDPDGDGFSNKMEGELGQEARIEDLVRDGGLSSRTSTAFVYADTSMVQATIKSDPAGFVTQSENFLALNSNIATASLNGETNGYHFAYWSVNGVRQSTPNGTSASQVDLNVSVTTQIVAHYLPSNEDSDSDGVMDWFELHQFGNLILGPNDDPDGDGFSNKREGELGQEARVKDLVRDGGLSSRTSPSILYFLQINNPPDGLDLNDTIVHANKPAGEQVGIFQPSDPDDANGQNAYQLSFLEGNGSTDKNLFAISGMNLLSAASLQVGNYSVNVRVKDDENASFDKNFTIQAILDPNKDDDNDGLTYSQEQALGTSDSNPDTDGDGATDKQEMEKSTSPLDANSYPPRDFVLEDKSSDWNSTDWQVYNGLFTFPQSNNTKPSVLASQLDLQFIGNYPPGPSDYAQIAGNTSVTVTENITVRKIHLWSDANEIIVKGSLKVLEGFSTNNNSDRRIIVDGGYFETPNINGSISPIFLTVQNGGTAIFNSDLSCRGGLIKNLGGTIEVKQNVSGHGATRWETEAGHVKIGGYLRQFRENSVYGGNSRVDVNGSYQGDGNYGLYFYASDGNSGVIVEDNASMFIRHGTGITSHDEDRDLTIGDNALFVTQFIDFTAKDLNGNTGSDNGKKCRVNLNGGTLKTGEVRLASQSEFNWRAGTLQPGTLDGPQKLLFHGDLNASDSNSSLLIEVTDASNYGSLEVNGTLQLGKGVLDLNLTALKEFDSVSGTLNAVVSAGQINGEFNSHWAGPEMSEVSSMQMLALNCFFVEYNGSAINLHYRIAGSFINSSPTDLNSTAPLSVAENQPVGTGVGVFHATDPDANATLTYMLVNGAEQNNNSLFNLDSNGTLKTATTFDYETNASTYLLTVQARDELNATTEGNFSISLINVIEDFDLDGIEDHHDTDDDNDGFTDSLEITYGSDPRDANSTANAAPQITLGNTFPNQLDVNGVFHIGHVENQTDIIRVTATDPDGDDLNYSIYGWQDLPHFEINASSGDLRFKQAPDFEELEDHNKDGVYGIVLRVSDGHVHTDQPAWIWLQNENEAPVDLNASGDLQFLEEQPAGTLVGNFSAHDSDANTTLTYSMLDGNGSSGNQYFILDPNGTLTTAQVFDYENNQSNYSIRIKVSDEYNATREGTFVIQLLNDPLDDFNSPDSNYTSPGGGYQTPPGDYQSPDGNYSSPSSDYQTPGTDYQSPSNSYEPSPENNQSIPNPAMQIYVPIVETFPPDHDGNGTYHLGGRILADGGSSPFEVGIVLSTKIYLSDPIRIAAQPDQNSSVFHVSYTDLLPGKTYYLRAYAVNQAGENQGSLKKFKTAQKTDPNSWYSKTEALPGGWKMSNWLGAFRPTEHQWIYHAEMGWLYPSPMEDGSLWLWNQTDGWSWTQDGVYPYLFRWKDSAWVYLQGRINGQILYYNYSTQSYE